ncbi:hypothetical protein JTE90_007558 [Oedothorax gibbosus]|uniref:Reverse transcriptase domain-containing protein n=1 Tax=Oedothorax gibbosus TaxID=931172 RepID=A0AAV6TPU5_9ARAC|nr:hypothetical protein JTE90_007558 [Oedothorax gibbosus]
MFAFWENLLKDSRLSQLLESVLDKGQFGFRPKDGIAEAINILDSAFEICQGKIQPLTLALIDLKKAFDSISHASIYYSLEALGIQSNFVNYIKALYSTPSTKLHFGGNISRPIIPSKGVRQGDPLSPLLFDNVLRTIPEIVGVKMLAGLTNHLAYADDLVLLTSDQPGLQNVFNIIVPVPRATGLEINISKSLTLGWVKDGKNKRIIFDHRPLVSVNNRYLESLDINNTFKYFGVKFTPKGRSPFKSDLRDKLGVLRSAPLKPQQKLFFLVRYLIPSYLHQLTFSKIYGGTLNKLDKLIRSFTHLVLHLPHDTPKVTFHSSVRDGGVGNT